MTRLVLQCEVELFAAYIPNDVNVIVFITIFVNTFFIEIDNLGLTELLLGENGGYPPTKNGDIRSLLCA